MNATHEFIKSSTTEDLKKYFQNIIIDHILKPETPEISTILGKMYDLETSISDSLRSGNRTYMLPRKVKEMSGYSMPLRIQQFKATVVWNTIYRDNPIDLPNDVYVLKMRLKTKADYAELEAKYPDIYEKVDKYLINGSIETFKKNGVTVLAIPSTLSELPDWVVDFIDYKTMIKDNLSKFYPVLESLGLSIPKAKGSIPMFSNILEI